jgi:ribosomal protein L11 methyltransferase PrmA/PRMT5 arginine-N-methyltransferase
MYSISAFGRMIADETRTNAYARALQAVVRPDSVVVDIGAGTGILSLLACRYGARKVFAVEPSDVIAVAREIACANGLDDRIEFIQAMSADVTLPERADVIVSDLHGVLPFFKQHLTLIIDARTRLLSSGGTLIPARECLWGAVVEAPRLYDRLVEPWSEDRSGFDMNAARRIVTNTWEKAAVDQDQLISEPCCWGTVDYSTVQSPDVFGTVTGRARRNGVAHGLVLWFDAMLHKDVRFSNAPGQPTMIYGVGFLPFSSAADVEAGDSIEVWLRAKLVGADYVWGWDTTIYRHGRAEPVVQLCQSSLAGVSVSPMRLRKRLHEYKPTLDANGEVDLFILKAMDGSAALEEIARALLARFPDRFKSEKKALTRVADLSEKYGATYPSS